MHEIKNPNVKTFFIANSGDEYSFGAIETDQCMTTGLDNIEVFEDEALYQNRLIELGFQKVIEEK